MRIIQAGNNYHIVGGSDRMMIETSKLLEANGHEVVPFAPKKEGNFETKWDVYFPDAFNTKTASIGDIKRYLYSHGANVMMTKLLLDYPIDVAHLHIYLGGLTTAILDPLKKKGVPIVQSLHEYRLACPVYSMINKDSICEKCGSGSFYNGLINKCNRGSYSKSAISILEAYYSKINGSQDKIDHFIAVSEFMKNKMLEHGIGKNKISTIHNFILVDEFQPDFNGGNYFLYFGRLERLKGIYTMVDAAIKSGHSLKLVGDGNEKNAIEDYILESKATNIEVLPFANGKKLHDLIRGSIATILPSEWYESFGLTIVESFALGKPVIATKIGGIPELIDDEKDGFLIDVGNSLQLSEKMNFLFHNPESAINMGKAGLKKAHEQFGPHTHYNKLISLYKSLK